MKNRIKKIITKVLIFLSFNRYIEFKPNYNCKIIFMMGMFRSGTSFSMSVFEKLGFDVGPSYRMLLGRGNLKNLNPNGFYEDFLYAQLSRIWFEDLNKSGDNPPSKKEVQSFILKSLRIKEFIKKSESSFKEDRISFINRHLSYLKLIIKKEKIFASSNRRLIKIPMLVPFHSQLSNWFPNSDFLIIIRNPSATIKSSERLTEKSNIDLYNKYYEHLDELDNNGNYTVISYDNLINQPILSLKKICDHFSVPFDGEDICLVDEKLIRNRSLNNIKSGYYEKLSEKIINKI
ncbi:MAG: sulfotransferase [Ignavibacteriae bacterium]|nr:sulfotransferase [Ignavibacteriota bacterium]HPF97437.1 sulfotransferase [Mangrovimonas sp.]